MATTKVNTEFIAVNAISGTIIADGAITSTHLAANCVDSSELVTGSIDTIHIAANQVTATKMRDKLKAQVEALPENSVVVKDNASTLYKVQNDLFWEGLF